MRTGRTLLVLGPVTVLLLAVGCSDTGSSGQSGKCPEGMVEAKDTCAWPNPGGNDDSGVGYGSDALSGADVAVMTDGSPFGGKDGALEDTVTPPEDTGTATADIEGDTGPCTDGYKRCADTVTIEVCKQGVWMPEPKCPGDWECKGGQCVQVGVCEPGAIEGCANETSQRKCDEEGESFLPVPCPDGQFCYAGECGDTVCGEGEKKCSSPNEVSKCSSDGKGWEVSEDCGEGSFCVGGVCQSGCAGLVKYGLSYIGCEYWTVDLDQYNEKELLGFNDPVNAPYGVVISNPGSQTVSVTFNTLETGTTFNITDPTVPPNSAKAFVLPSMNVEGTSITKKSVQILTDRPVFVHQFNPINNENVATNDASLLLPVHVLGDEYYVMTWPSSPTMQLSPEMPAFEGQRGYFTVVAVKPGETIVTVEMSDETLEGTDIPAMKAGDKKEFTLEQYDVLNIEADAKFEFFGPIIMGDLTGTHVYANKPIVVFSGHEEAVVGSGDKGNPEDDTCCAEHLEEQMFPVTAWRKDVLAVKTKPRGGTEPDCWRIMGGANAVKITTTPSIPGLDGQVLGKGKWVEVYTKESFEIAATGPIQVAQLTVSQGQTQEGTGDPSLILAVPTAQFRSEYHIMVPKKYAQNYVTIVRPKGALIQYDADQAVPDVTFTSFGSGAYEFAYLGLPEGYHHFYSEAKFGLSAYGWSNVVSYGYPGGLDLTAE